MENLLLPSIADAKLQDLEVTTSPLPPQYEPVVTGGNEALVHHMEVFQCSPHFPTFPHYSGPCHSKMKPRHLDFCRHVLAAWAMGAQVSLVSPPS